MKTFEGKLWNKKKLETYSKDFLIEIVEDLILKCDGYTDFEDLENTEEDNFYDLFCNE